MAKIGRNDPCACGSGKKYKKCCMTRDEAAAPAERAAHDLLARFPDVHDGYDRLGMVYEARGDHRQAADCYRKAITIIRNHPDNYDPGFEAIFQKLVDRLETQAEAATPTG